MITFTGFMSKNFCKAIKQEIFGINTSLYIYLFIYFALPTIFSTCASIVGKLCNVVTLNNLTVQYNVMSLLDYYSDDFVYYLINVFSYAVHLTL